MLTDLHLYFEPLGKDEGDRSTFRATLRQAGTELGSGILRVDEDLMQGRRHLQQQDHTTARALDVADALGFALGLTPPPEGANPIDPDMRRLGEQLVARAESSGTRLVLHLDDATELEKLAWEALGFPDDESAPDRPRDVAIARWRILRGRNLSEDRSGLDALPERVDAIVGGVDPEDSRRQQRADEEIVDALDQLARSLPFEIKLNVFVSANAYKRRIQNGDGWNGTQFSSFDELVRRVTDNGGPDALFLVGHGSDPKASEPASLDLGLPCSGTEGCPEECLCRFAWLDDCHAHDFRVLLTGERTRLALLHVCHGDERKALPLLSREQPAGARKDALSIPGVDHVVGLQTKVRGDFLAAFWAPFFEFLANGRPVGIAVQHARSATLGLAVGKAPYPAGVPTHWARTLDELAFANDETRALERFLDGQLNYLLGLEAHYGNFGPEMLPIPLWVDSTPEQEVSEQRQDRTTQPRRSYLDELLEEVHSGELNEERRMIRPQTRLLIRGEPGSGKTTLARDYARRRLRDRSSEIVPLYVNLASWARKCGDDPSLESLVEFVLNNAKYPKDSVLRTLVRKGLDELAKNGRLVVLLDGVDEILGEFDGVDRIKNLIEVIVPVDSSYARAHPWRACALVITTRPQGFAPLVDYPFRQARIEELDRAQRIELVLRLFALKGIPEAAARARAEVDRIDRAGSELTQIARVPLFLRLIAERLAEDESDMPSALRHLFLGEMVKFLILERHKPQRQRRLAIGEPGKRQLDIVRAALRERAAQLALGMTEAQTTEIDSDEQVEAWLAGETRQVHAWDTLHSDLRLLRDAGESLAFLRDCGLLIALDLSGGPWRFRHRSFQEALAAEALVQPLRKQVEPDVGPLLERVRKIVRNIGETETRDALEPWREPLALAVGHMSTLDDDKGTRCSEDFVSALLSEETTKPIAVSAVPLAPGLSDETIDRVFRACTPDTGRRSFLAHLRRRLLRQHAEPRADYGDLALLFRHLAPLSHRDDLTIRQADTLLSRPDFRNARTLVAIDDALLTIAGRPDSPASKHKTARRLRDKLFARFGPGDDAARNELVVELEQCPNVGGSAWTPLIPSGRFWMGSSHDDRDRQPDEGPAEVELSRGFRIARTPVTRGQYRTFDSPPEVSANLMEDSDDFPVRGIDWFTATLFCRWLTRERLRLTGEALEVRLPSEAEWEFVCRGRGTYGTRFHFGDDAEFLKVYAHCGFPMPASVAMSSPLEFDVPSGTKVKTTARVYDLHGNIWEWCQDWYEHVLQGGLDPRGPGSGSSRVLRGGCFHSPPDVCRTANRSWAPPETARSTFGFRLVLSE